MRTRRFIKRFWTSFFGFLLVFSFSSSVSFAETDVFSYTDFYDETEFNEITELVSKRSGLFSLSNILGPDGKDLSKLSYSYKMHGGSLLFLADSSVPVSEGISKEYSWILLTDTLAQIRISKTGGNWEVGEFGEAPKNAFTNHIRISMLQDAVSSLTVKNIIAFDCSRMSRAVFVYIQAEEGEFLVPFPLRPDFTKLRTGKLYTRVEVSEVVSKECSYELKQIEEASAKGITEEIFNGGSGVSSQALPSEPEDISTGQKALPPGVIAAIAGGCTVIIVIAILAAFLLKKRKPRNK